MDFTAKPITAALVEYWAADNRTSLEAARAELEDMRSKGCLLYDFCPACPRYQNDTCPFTTKQGEI